MLPIFVDIQAELPRESRKLLDRVHDQIRVKYYSYRIEETYVRWIRKFILFYNKRHPIEMGVNEVNTWLTHLEFNENLAVST